MFRKIRLWLDYLACRINEAEAGTRGDYRTAHYWLDKAEKIQEERRK